MPFSKRTVTADDFFPRKEWDGLALTGYMLPDPYSGVEGVREMLFDVIERRPGWSERIRVALETKEGERGGITREEAERMKAAVDVASRKAKP